ncbi:pyridoxamine 5'-phosphate oxidase [Alphaproteobacteria bacterium KMM 3653]|uniref:Pyridoxamine 5'-phosphate oxidase n=1 Tax=Harenicola maris TaxID=2841044 RepID=A0AAP2CME6_9RHOB|nr:pyridoxamine 5'-phosphate oxidase [Harenicola maris]
MTHNDLSSDRQGIFAGDDPFALAREWFAAAELTEPNDPDAVAMASVDAQGMPNVRTVLLRVIAEDSFVFFTNYESAKGEEMLGAGKAAFIWHSKTQRRQIRVRGTVEREDGAVADHYYNSRSLPSRLGAWASDQSRPITDRGVLEARFSQAEAEQGDAPKRPKYWGGLRIFPLEIEFWADGAHRLHDRFRWTRREIGASWKIERLFP